MSDVGNKGIVLMVARSRGPRPEDVGGRGEQALHAEQ